MNLKRKNWLPLFCTLPLAAACLFTGCASKGAVSSSAPVSDTAASTSAVQTQQTAETEGTTAPSSAAATTAGSPSPSTAPAVTAKTTRAKTTAASSTAKPTTTTKPGPRPTLPDPKGTQSINSLTYKNKERIGDWGGPAYTVYSKKGYNRASMDVALSDVEINMIRRSDKKTLVGYAFLGMDVWHPTGGYWVNCMDAGLKYDGNSGKWVLFHFIYDVSAANQQKWYESHKALDPTHDYRISLDCSKSEGWTTLSAYDLTEGREADSVTFQARYAKKDGSNVSFYQDFAIDMPDDLMRDPDGNIYEVDSAISDEGWAGIILYSTNEDVYLRNLKVVNSMLNGQPWTADKTRLRGFSPDSLQPYIGYEVVKVTHANFDNEFQVDIDLKK